MWRSAARQQLAPVVNHLSGNGIAQQEVTKHLRSGWGPGKSRPVQCTILASTAWSMARSLKTPAVLLMTARLDAYVACASCCQCSWLPATLALMSLEPSSSHASFGELGAVTAGACAAAGTRGCQRCMMHTPSVRSTTVLRQHRTCRLQCRGHHAGIQVDAALQPQGPTAILDCQMKEVQHMLPCHGMGGSGHHPACCRPERVTFSRCPGAPWGGTSLKQAWMQASIHEAHLKDKRRMAITPGVVTFFSGARLPYSWTFCTTSWAIACCAHAEVRRRSHTTVPSPDPILKAVRKSFCC